MDFEFPDSLLEILTGAVSDATGSHSSDYPFDEIERAEAANVQAALRMLGHEVSISDAAGLWENYSFHLQAGWITGAETVKSAGECIRHYCEELRSES